MLGVCLIGLNTLNISTIVYVLYIANEIGIKDLQFFLSNLINKIIK